jgi:hypothetical protein
MKWAVGSGQQRSWSPPALPIVPITPPLEDVFTPDYTLQRDSKVGIGRHEKLPQ